MLGTYYVNDFNKYDRVFKEIFAKEENKDILIKLLESIIKVKIEKVEYLNLERLL